MAEPSLNFTPCRSFTRSCVGLTCCHEVASSGSTLSVRLLNITSDSYTAAWMPLPRALFCEWMSMVWMSLEPAHLNGFADAVGATVARARVAAGSREQASPSPHAPCVAPAMQAPCRGRLRAGCGWDKRAGAPATALTAPGSARHRAQRPPAAG